MRQEAPATTEYPAGWYPDNTRPGQQRFFDGRQWTDYVYVPEAAGDGAGRKGRRRLPKFRPSAQLVDSAYRMLFADRAMIALLFLGAVVASAAAGVILFPAIHWGNITPSWSGGGALGVLVAGTSLGAASFVIQLVGGAVVAAALLRADGHAATVREALRMAWGRRRQLLAWALVSTFVGAAIRMLERVGVGGVLAAVGLNLGWAVATVFATPVIMVEGTMPAATMRRSADLLRRQFTVTLLSSVTLALPWIVLGVTAIGVAAVGGLVWAFGSGIAATAIGVSMVATGALGFMFVGVVSSALSCYLETFLYRHAVGLPVPGVDRRWLPPVRPS